MHSEACPTEDFREAYDFRWQWICFIDAGEMCCLIGKKLQKSSHHFIYLHTLSIHGIEVQKDKMIIVLAS